MIKVDQYLYRGPRPANPNDLLDKKIGAIISLESGLWDLATNDEYENFDFYKFKIAQISIGLSDFMPPTKNEINRALEAIEYFRSRGVRVYVHCKSGVDRTGFIMAVYRMKKEGWTFKEAHAEWVTRGRHFWYFWWKSELKKYEGSF